MNLQFEAITGKGRRSTNQDHHYPAHAGAAAFPGLFIVCDGVGGTNKGEIASRLTCEALVEYFTRHTGAAGSIKEKEIHEAIQFSEQQLDQYTATHPDAKGMATTVALAWLTHDKIYISHIGDTRVYLLRRGSIEYQTRDHSLVNELVASGYLTESEAITHPRRNVITRAVSGSAEAAEPETVFFSGPQKNDILMICSDGVLEAVDDAFIRDTVGSSGTLAGKIKLLEQRCRESAKDNYTCILTEIN